MSETFSAKCYVFKCFVCGGLDVSHRSDKTTCSSACRVKAHRQGILKRLRKRITEQVDRHFTPAHMARFHAVRELCPDLAARIEAGELELDDMAVRQAAHDELWRHLCLEVKA